MWRAVITYALGMSLGLSLVVGSMAALPISH